MAVVTERVPAVAAVVALPTPKLVPHHQILPRCQLLVQVLAVARAETLQLVAVAKALAMAVRLAVKAVDGSGCFGWQGHVDAVADGVDQDDVRLPSAEDGEGPRSKLRGYYPGLYSRCP